MIEMTPARTNGRHTDIPETDWSEAVQQIHLRLLQDMDLAAVERLDHDRARQAVAIAARTLITQMYPSLLGDDREHIISRVTDEAVGYGPIEPLLQDGSVSEVMVNAPDQAYFERHGIIHHHHCRF